METERPKLFEDDAVDPAGGSKINVSAPLFETVRLFGLKSSNVSFTVCPPTFCKSNTTLPSEGISEVFVHVPFSSISSDCAALAALPVNPEILKSAPAGASSCKRPVDPANEMAA